MKDPSINKKTTLMIEDGLYAEVRRRAAADGVSTSSVVSEALRAYVARPRENPFRNLTQGAGEWIGPDLSKMSNAEMYALLDEGLPWEKLR